MTTLSLVLTAWVPLLVLSGLEQRAFSGARPFFNDFAVQTRMLVILPTLWIGRRLANYLFARAMNFLVDAHSVTEETRARFERRLERFGRWRDSFTGLLILVAGALVLSWAEHALPANRDVSWKYGENGLTSAGLWYYAVARPLLLTLLLSWVSTFLLWAWLLVGIVRLPLITPAYHPDQSGGLEPVLTAHRSFTLLSFAIGAEFGGALANRLVHYDEPFMMYRLTLIAVVVLLTLVALAPLALFARSLVPARLDATDEFCAMGFELSRTVKADTLETARARALYDPMIPLISAHADASGGFQVIKATRGIPITHEYALNFLLAPLVPIALAALTRMPLLEVIEQLRKLLLA